MRGSWFYCALRIKNSQIKLEKGLQSSEKLPLYLMDNPYDIVDYVESCNLYAKPGVNVNDVMCLAVRKGSLDRAKLERIDGFVWNLKNPYIYHGVIDSDDLFLITDLDGLIGKITDVKRKKRFWK